MLTDLEINKMHRRLGRAKNGVQGGSPPAWMLDLTNALREIEELQATVNELVDQLEQ